jgi:flavin reductase (DIM6/NTAB) family NADH-FMN oxidoreductase RutF
MPPRRELDPSRLVLPPFDVWEDRWWLLCAGDHASGSFNAMTVAWGSLGVMWRRPFAMVVVRPTRHTHGFMEAHPSFTLCLLPREQREALNFFGSRSGRDTDKFAATGLLPVPSTRVAAPTVEPSELVLECESIYRDDFDPTRFERDFIAKCYPLQDYHRFYFGEVVAVLGTDAWRTAE